MKITIEPDSSDVEFIRTHSQALNLIKSFLRALGFSEAYRERWDDVLWVEIDTSSTIKFEGMTCYLPDTIKNQQSWKYSTLFYNSGYLLLLNGSPFWAKMTDTNAVDDLPSDLINFSCSGWPFNELSQSFNKFNQLRALDLHFSKLLTNITPLENFTQLNWLNLFFCDSLLDITPLTNLTQLNSLNLSVCKSLSDITPLTNLTQLNSLDITGCEALSDIKSLDKFIKSNSLDLSGCSSLFDITPLTKLTQLNSLNLSSFDSLPDITLLKNLSQLSSLDLSHCSSLLDITLLTNLTQLNSLNLSYCNSLSDITPLKNLSQLTSLDLSYCSSLFDITPLTNLTQLNSLDLSYCNSLSDLTPIANLKQLARINLFNCTSISNIHPIQFLQQIKKIDIQGCLRLTQFPDFKQLKHLQDLDATLHPAVVSDILAHCAVSRKDWVFIKQNADFWTSELESALKDSHPAAFDLATSLAIAFPQISIELSEHLCQILQTDVLLDYRPWKHLFLGLFQQMGFNALPNLANTIAAGSWPRGAIGGLSAIAEQLITLADGKELFAGWVRAISAHHESNPSFLKPVAAPWCLALHCLGENALLDQWIARFTDTDDSTALDAVFLEFGNHRLGHNDATGAFRHAMRIRATLVRDGLLADIASHYLEAQQADQAAELLFLLSAEDKRAELSLKLADIPHFLDNRDNLHCLLAACGKNAPAIGKLLAKAGMDETVFLSDADDERQRAAQDAAQMVSIRTGMDAAHVDNLSALITQFLRNKGIQLMKITVQPDPDDVRFIRTNCLALNLIKSFLQALGISEADRERWDDVLWAEIDTSSTIEFEGMTCYLPDTIKNEQSWKYSTLFHNSFYLLLLNGLPFLAKMTNINAVDDLPSDLINFSCEGWPLNDLSKSFTELNQLKSLNLYYSQSLTNITPLTNLTQLASLNLSHCNSLSDITPLTNLTQLTSLNLSYCDELLDITPLTNLTQLTSLILERCSRLKDITPLTKLTQLISLSLMSCNRLKDITPIKKLTKLKSLHISNYEFLSDTRLLEKLTQLTSLYISWCISLTDITPIEKLTQLTSLNIEYFESLTDVTSLEKLTQLTSLKLTHTHLSDITPLEKLTQLKSLDISGSQSLLDITPLEKLTQLKSLDISSCESLLDITPLKKLTQLTSLDLSHYGSLPDITPLTNLTQLNSLNISHCESLLDITPLEKLINLMSLDISKCESLSDITPLEKLINLKSLDISNCKSLSDITPIANLKNLIEIVALQCHSISNLSPIQYLPQIKKIDIRGCLRVTQFPDFKQLKNLQYLDATLHPTVVPDILAHCAVSREDWTSISYNAAFWTSELESALKASHPAAFDLATSLAIAFPHISFKLCERLCQILQTDPLLDYRPWKQLFLGLFQQMGFNALPNLANTIVLGSWPRGAIGGLSAIAEQLITLADGKELFAGWVRATSAQHESNPSFLKPVAAPWCLALHCLGENALLDQWIARFTDPDDSTALDAVFLEFGNHRLGHNDAPGAFRHAMRIRATLVRDGLLGDIASHYLEAQQADQAAELLFLLSAEDKRAELSLKLADIPHFLDNRDNLHRLLAACGKNAPAIGKLLAKAGMEETVFPGDADDERQRAAEIMSSVMRLIPGFDAETAARIRHLINNN